MDKSLIVKDIVTSRPPHFHEDFPLILLWSQKSGCTSLAKWFFLQIGLLEEAVRYSPWIHSYEFDIYKAQKDYCKQVEQNLLASTKKVYKLVRNPYKRAVSSFISLHSSNALAHTLADIKQHLYNDPTREEGISFKQFLLYLQAQGTTVHAIDGHIAQQYLEGEETIVNTYVYLETLEQQIREIEKEYGLLHSPLSKLSESNHHIQPYMRYDGNYADIKTTNPSFKFWPTYKSFYTEETKRLVEELFYQDFTIYKYDRTLPNF